MCGIAGLINYAHAFSKHEMKAIVTKMADQMRHRGPDDFGVWVAPDGNCAFSHSRLAIIDLSSSGRQPMKNGNERYCITYNGEIYNFLELKEELRSIGVRFRTETDTEVLLEACAAYREKVFQKLDGMYAFGLYDLISRKLTLARDPFGEKPLYYYKGDRFFAFASELSALLVLPGFKANLDMNAVAEYLLLQYIHAPRAIVQGINKVVPGHYLELSMDRTLVSARHFEFNPDDSRKKEGREINNLAEELENILLNSIKKRLISNVPVGAFLSGGVDSSIIVSLIKKGLKEDVAAYSFGFEGIDASEHVYAAETATYLGIKHYKKVVPPNILQQLPQIAAMLDEPNGDTSCLPTYLLSRFAKNHVSVALSGDGGDEIFGGYTRYLAHFLEERRYKNGHSKYKNWNPGFAYFSSYFFIFSENEVQEFLGHMPLETQELLDRLRASLNDPLIPYIHRMRKVDVETYLPGSVLAKVDRMSMRNSLEVRAPFLGLPIVRFAEKLGVQFLCQNGEGKLILKAIGRRYLPSHWLERKKMGFGLPVSSWVTPGFIHSMRPLLLSKKGVLRSIIGEGPLDAFVKKQENRRSFSLYKAWSILLLEHWLQRHIPQLRL